MTYGFLTEEELNRQYDLYVQALENSDGDKWGYQYPENLRHMSFLKITKRKSTLTDNELRQVAELAKLDPDQIMAESILKSLIE